MTFAAGTPARRHFGRLGGLVVGLLFGLLAVAVDAQAAPVASFTATPLQGATCVAPCAVHFDANGTDDAQYTREFHTMVFRWTFGDTASASRTWWHTGETGVSRNQDSGPIVGHVYDTPGTYTATLTVTAPDGETGTATRTVTVANPNTVFAATTWCFSTGANFAGCPNDANGDGDCIDAGDSNRCVTLGANQFDDALRNSTTGAPRGCNADESKSRCLFKGGDNFSSNAMVELYKSTTPGLIGSFGTGRANVAASWNTQFELRSGWQVTGLAFNCGTTDNCGIFQREWPTAPIDRAGIYNVSIVGRVSNCATGFGMGNVVLNHDVWFIGNTCNKTGTTTQGTQFLFPYGNRNLIIGNDADSNVLASQQLTVRALVTNSAISHNSLRGPGSASDQRGVLQLRGDIAGGGAPNMRNEVAYNQLATRYGPEGAGLDWTKICSHHSGCNSTSAEGATCSDVIYENNFHVIEGAPNLGVGQAVQVQCSDTTVRNNVFDIQGQQGLGGGATIVGLWELPAGVPNDDRIQVYNNTLYLPGNDSGSFLACVNNSNGGTGHECRNNLAYMPGHTGSRAITYGSGWTASNNDIRTSPNPFPATPPGQGQTDWNDFLRPSTAACIATGSTTPGAVTNCVRTGGAIAPAVCGNGVRQGSEACDDGNTVSGDGCSATCTIETTAVCGNGIREGSEACDDGNSVAWDGCSSTCTIQVAVCGNGVRQGAEACDDGNSVAWDGCSPTCTIQVAVCGNGVRQGAEACDDGNSVAWDGCSPTCTIQVAVCGNGVRQGAEACDDGNSVAWDGCSPTCTIQVAVCGNGVRQGAEACDDGNSVAWDGCSSTCTIQVAVCGNGVRQGPEACDDGNTTSWDGCSSTCSVEVAVCGNGHLQGSEACDDGNTASWDGCSSTCAVEVPVCGNGHTQGTESCDDGNTVSGDGCSSSCGLEVAVCGNGLREGIEGCDDGNVMGGDGCSASCLTENGTGVPLEYLINDGGATFTAINGAVWTADTSFFQNSGRVAFTNLPVAGTSNDRLYQSRRYGPITGAPLVLEFPVTGTGPYRVRVHFAELDGGITRVGQRVFNVAAEDVFTLSNLDVFASVGFARAYSQFFYVNVDDGALTLRFEPVAGEPIVCGVEILEQTPPTSPPEFIDPCAEYPDECQ